MERRQKKQMKKTHQTEDRKNNVQIEVKVKSSQKYLD